MDPVARLRSVIDQSYSYRDLRNVDWPAVFELYGPKLHAAPTAKDFALIAADMLAAAKDPHLWVKVGNQKVGGFTPELYHNFNLDLLKQIVPEWTEFSQQVAVGRFADNTGYLLIRSWSKGREEAVLKPALAGLQTLSGCPALIIDVRCNGGGSEELARAVAGCFVDRPRLYAKNISREPTNPTGWGIIQNRILLTFESTM